MLNKTALVITSISSPNSVLSKWAEGCKKHKINFILVGDISSPPEFHLPDCDFWDIERQRRLSSRLANILPEKHYARKNLGYLVAMKQGIEIIIETDDDNSPLEDFWAERKAKHIACLYEEVGWVNIYRYFTNSLIWPRGFPLEHIHSNPSDKPSIEQEIFCPIQQGLANDNPDVDAIFRLIMALPQKFSKKVPVAIGKGSWSPFNSQNTTWFKEAFPLLYIPSYCSFRMCDIWRSFVALRICWENDWTVLFHSPTVYQERNEHNLLHDFKDEIPGYLNNTVICEELASLDLNAGQENIGDNLKKCYKLLIHLGLIYNDELELINAWISDLEENNIIST